jgi:hypothetical protein
VVPTDHVAGMGAGGKATSRGERYDSLMSTVFTQRSTATHWFRARESATACTTRM